MASLAETPLPPHATEVELLPEGFTVLLTPQYARVVVLLAELFPGMRVVARRDLRAL